MQHADNEKIKLLNWMIKHLKARELIGSEVQFYEGRYRADLMIVSNRRLCAIEVKSPKDDLRRLLKQLSGYQRMFLEVYVAIAENHAEEVKATMPDGIGIIMLSEKKIRIGRKAIVRKLLKKHEALSWLRTEDMKRILRSKKVTAKKTVIGLRDDVEELLSRKELSNEALISIMDRLKFRYAAFQRERGNIVTLDDLRMLQIPNLIS